MRSEGKIELFNEDCMLTMKRIASGTVDLILTDPPYNTTQCEWEYDIDLTALWAEWQRILKPNGVICVFADEPFTSRFIVSILDWFKYRITWDKMTGSNFLNARKMPLRQTEDVVIFSGVNNGNYTYNPILIDKPKNNIRPMGNQKPKKASTYGEHNGAFHESYDNTKSHPTNLLSISSKQGECNPLNRWHPTQKPTEIMQWLVKTFSNQHEIVFDGYSGSGVTAIACEIENRNFIGSELNEEYYKKALQRIKDETAQLKIF
jgi:site-specific DNA-methyltransferase (adenine-specific)